MARRRGGSEQLMMYTLYYSPGTASMCVHQAAYLKLNPGGVVPTLLIDDVPFIESGALLMTIATRHPEAGLAPAENSPSRVASVDRLYGHGGRKVGWAICLAAAAY
jgi:glutathione S-transferase